MNYEQTFLNFTRSLSAADLKSIGRSQKNINFDGWRFYLYPRDVKDMNGKTIFDSTTGDCEFDAKIALADFASTVDDLMNHCSIDS